MGVPVVVTVNCREGGTWDEGQEMREIKIIPNPFTDEFTVYGLEFTTGDRMQIIDVLGKVVLEKIISNQVSSIQLPASHLQSGIYFLQITTSSEKKTVKVVKQ